MEQIINAKRLRASLPDIVDRVRRGESFTVLYRSRPAFRVVPPNAPDSSADLRFEEDPLYRAKPLGRSTDGLTSRDHDNVLYGKRKS
jgi:antitoxin (DNA-binding transcriptional repressor) of toxin-antitoxin stability system